MPVRLALATAPVVVLLWLGIAGYLVEKHDSNLRAADEVTVIAGEVGATPAQVALAWVLAQGEHFAPIPGTKRVARVEENVAADDVTLTADQLRRLDEIAPPIGDHHSEAQMQLLDR